MSTRWDHGTQMLEGAQQSPGQQLAAAKARIVQLEQELHMERTSRMLMQRRLRSMEQGVPTRYARHTEDWADVDFALLADRGGQ